VCGAAAGTLASTRGEVGFSSVSGLVAATRTSSTARTPRNSAAGSSLRTVPSCRGTCPAFPYAEALGCRWLAGTRVPFAGEGAPAASPSARTTTLPEASSGRRWRATGWWSPTDSGRPDTPLCAGSARPPPRLGCRRRSWRPSRLPTSRDDAVRPGRAASSGVIVRVGCGEADGVAAGFAASGYVDELVDQPQAEGRSRKGIVG
jgi:hypothetical protein